MHELTVGSLFSGIGGIDLGLERAGMRTKWFVENDPHCRNVLARHWPGVPIYGDIRELDWTDVERVDVLVGGFPCQPISAAGQQRAQEDARWLWPEFARAIRVLRPRYVLVENVRNLLAVNGGSAFAEVLGDLAESGYDAEWDCIPASAIGAPHQRDRLWIVAYPTGSRLERAAWSRSTGTRQPPVVAARRGGAPLADTYFAGLERRRRLVERTREQLAWANGETLPDGRIAPPGIPRVAHGVPHRVDRLRSIGNAVVPQVVEHIGESIVALDADQRVAA